MTDDKPLTREPRHYPATANCNHAFDYFNKTSANDIGKCRHCGLPYKQWLQEWKEEIRRLNPSNKG